MTQNHSQSEAVVTRRQRHWYVRKRVSVMSTSL